MHRVDLRHDAFFIVRLIGLEPTQPELPDPKSGASTNFATDARTLQLPAKVLHFSDSARCFSEKSSWCQPCCSMVARICSSSLLAAVSLLRQMSSNSLLRRV